MSNIGGLSSGTSSSLSGIKGYGGLASGLDRDALIEGMTIGTRTKIAAQTQKKDALGWKQEAYRSISEKMIEMTQKYTSFSSSTNLSSGAFFSKNIITAIGMNSKYLEVAGSLKGNQGMSIIGVKQLAMDAKLTTSKPISDQVLQSGGIPNDLTTLQNISNLEGKSIDFKYGDQTYRVKLQSGTSSTGFTYDYSTEEKAAASIQESMMQVEVSGGKKIGELVDIKAGSDGKFTLSSKDTAGNTIALAGGTQNVLRHLGFLNESESIDSLEDDRKIITAGGLKGNEAVSIHTETSFLDRIAGKQIQFNYNGVSKNIKLPEKDDLKTIDDLISGLQSGLDEAFGAGRIKVGSKKIVDVDGEKTSLQFTTTKPPKGEADTSSILKVTGAESGLLGTSGALGMNPLESNRINLSAPLWQSGLVRYDAAGVSNGDELELTINGVKIEGLTYNSSMSEVIKKINETSKAGVEITYLENADKFVVNAKDGGASGQLEISGKGAEILFGEENTDYTIEKGRDAIVTVQYAGSDEKVDIVRGSNSFKIDGLSITVNEKFGFEESVDDKGNILYTEKADNEPVKFSGKSDSAKVLEAVKDFIDDYNDLLETVNKQLTGKPNRSYKPLTQEQRKEMSEEEIKAWEEKAKEGLLFNDGDLRGISDSMRFLASGDFSMRKQLESIGITVSTSYSDNGKLIFDEEKFKEALEGDAEVIQEVFSRQKDESIAGDKGGFMVQFKAVLDKYASTTGATKGILIERAGSKSAPTSMLKNALQKEMDSIDKYILQLESKLAMEQNRYVAQFTNLETLMSKMNTQSSWLSQQFG